MNYGKSLGIYKKTGIETAGKIDLIIMCYEKTIQFLIQSKTHFEKNEPEDETDALEKALAIINELRCSLNLEKGGQIAGNLYAIYDYCNRRLLQWGVERDQTAFDEVILILSELKGAWEGIALEKENRINISTDPSSITTNRAQIAAESLRI